MAYSANQTYLGATEADPDFKDGKFKDNSPSTVNNGSPLKAIDRNQRLALDDAVMTAAGMDYNGQADTPQNSQLFAAYKAALGGGVNLLSNHNFLKEGDSSQPTPDATPRNYGPSFEVFAGVFANDTIGVSNLTKIDDRISFSGGDLNFEVPNTNGIDRITDFVASVADFDGKPRTRGVSFILIGDKYRVTVGVDALTDASGNPTPLGSVKFEAGTVPTRHELDDAKYLNFLSDSVTSDSSDTGASSKAVKITYDQSARAEGRVVDDLNNYKTSGMFGLNDLPANSPLNQNFSALIVATNIDTGLQIVGGRNNPRLAFRGWSNYGVTWGAWQELATMADIAGGGGGGGGYDGVTSLISTKASTGTWTITGLVVGKPVYLTVVGDGHLKMNITSGVDGVGYDFATGKVDADYAKNDGPDVFIPTSSTMVIEVLTNSTSAKAYQ